MAVINRMLDKAPAERPRLNAYGVLLDNGKTLDYGCEKCVDSKGIIITEQGAKECECLTKWKRATAFDQVPYEYRFLINTPLAELKPELGRHPRQADVLRHIQTYPTRSLMLCGPTGVGKSMACWALFCEAVRQGRRTHAHTLTTLLTEFQEYETGKRDVSPLDLDQFKRPIRSALDQQLVFIDELAERTPTSYRTSKLKELVKAIVNYGHQIITTSQHPVTDGKFNPGDLFPLKKLAAIWSSANPADGEPIMRELLEPKDGLHAPTFFELY